MPYKCKSDVTDSPSVRVYFSFGYDDAGLLNDYLGCNGPSHRLRDLEDELFHIDDPSADPSEE